VQINNILIDILDWVRKVIWSRQQKLHTAPFVVISLEKTITGLLKKVERLTPRSVSTYIMTPNAPPKYSKDIHYDYHLCLDHLWKLDSVDTEIPLPKIEPIKSFRLHRPITKPELVIPPYRVSVYGGKYSHCITILQCSRFIDAEGNYSSKVIYQGYYDLIGSRYTSSSYRDRWAFPVFLDLITECKTKEVSILEFNDIIEQSRKRHLGYGYKPNTGSIYLDTKLEE
jgi:hypothetical protein